MPEKKKKIAPSSHRSWSLVYTQIIGWGHGGMNGITIDGDRGNGTT